MGYEHFVVAAARVVEVTGVALLLLGALLAAVAFARRLVRRAAFQDAYHALRADLGRAILLGLELLVIADIIGTVAIEPTLQNLGVLAVIVAIRTLLSFALEWEVSGRWPWQRAQAADRHVGSSVQADSGWLAVFRPDHRQIQRRRELELPQRRVRFRDRSPA